MTARVLLLVSLSACKTGSQTQDSARESTAQPQDDDGDGYSKVEDCNDQDSTIHPNATESCDGIDQDCDGAVDEGIPGDGDGCQDPGLPELSDTIETLHLYLRTTDVEFGGTDDGDVSVCLSEDLCIEPYKVEWDDLERGIVDVHITEDLEIERSSLDRFQIGTTDGTDQWNPSGFQVVLDGDPVYCHETQDLLIGNESDEVLSWTDPDGLVSQCGTIFDSHLTHGPIIGAVESDRARIWVRSDATRQVLLRVADSESALEDAPPIHYGYPLATNDFTETVEVLGLEPDRAYSYDLEIEGERLGPWTFHTAPAPDSSGSFRFSFGSCSRYDDQPVFGAITASDPDFFIFVGDNHYGNTSELSALRQFYRWAHERYMRAQMMAEVPILATWDDHDFTGNNTDGSDPGKATALRVFEEYWANPSYGNEETSGTFFMWSWGDVDFFVLDDRYWRGLEDSVLGSAQTDWLVDGLKSSTGVFKFLVSGSQWTSDGSSDSWAAFPEARNELLEEIRDAQITGVVFLSGDVHRSEFRIMDGADGSYEVPELTSSPLSNSTSGCSGVDDELLSCFSDEPSWVSVDIDTTVDDPVLVATILNEAGGTIDRVEIRASELEF